MDECKPLIEGGHKTLLAWALEYGGGGLHEVKLLSATILHITDPAIARVGRRRCRLNPG